MRAARIPAQAIHGTMNAMDTAGRVMQGLMDAGRAAVEELKGSVTPAPAPPKEGTEPPPSPPAEEKRQEPPTGTA